MPKLKVLSGRDVIDVLMSFGFKKISQRGSHIKIGRATKTGRETLTIPNHTELGRGTLKAIFRQVSRYIPQNELLPHFFHI